MDTEYDVAQTVTTELMGKFYEREDGMLQMISGDRTKLTDRLIRRDLLMISTFFAQSAVFLSKCDGRFRRDFQKTHVFPRGDPCEITGSWGLYIGGYL
jgi:hypothetical protein